jgi:heme/copper-type cytochrome/quinol oxidase subunit 1
MRGLSFAFFISGVVAVLIGMVWGIVMAASGDHLYSPAHAHLNLLGWVTFSIFAVYYHLVPVAAQSRLARVHLVLAVSGLILLVPGIVMALSGSGEVLAIIGSFLSLASMAVFLAVVLKTRDRSADLTGTAVPAE